ncbi:replication [Tokyovirus A1]|uniref:replication n=1 Tax=Tokyovirus A1 TaxID=1826170 RepID=UPI0007A98AA6|nr:replication [Tokyovirus A1]BAU79923.1 putative helicase [Tokyovirus A1]
MADRLSQSENTTNYNLILKPDFVEPETWDGKFGCPLCDFEGEDGGDLKRHYQSEEHRKRYSETMQPPEATSKFYERGEGEGEQEYSTRVSLAFFLGKLPRYCCVQERFGAWFFSNSFRSKHRLSKNEREKRGEVGLPSPQKLAHIFGESCGHDFFFAYETTRYSRSYGSYPTFQEYWKNYVVVPDNEKRFHEQFLKGHPTREIFDLDSSDFSKEEILDMDFPKLFQKLRREFSPEEKFDFFITEACGEESGKYKTSFHVVTTKTHYDLVSMKGLCEEFIKFLEKRRDGELLAKMLDIQVYTTNRTIRSPWSVKSESSRRLLPIAEHTDKDPIEFFGTPKGYLWMGEYTEPEPEEVKFRCLENPGEFEDVLNEFVENDLEGVFEIQRQGETKWRIQREKGQSNNCPFCDREHDADNYLASVYNDRLWIYCFRAGRYFPITAPTKNTQKSKKPRKLEKTDLPELKADFCYSSSTSRPIIFQEGKACIAIQGGMGTGKTKALANYLKTRPFLRVLAVTYRRTLAREMSNNLPGFSNYEDEGKGWLFSSRLVVQIDSLHRVSGKYDLFVCDEVTYTLARLFSDIKEKESCWRTFKYYLKNTKRVLAMDKNLDQTTIDLFEQNGVSCHVVRNEHKAHSDKKVLVLDGFLEFKEALLRDLAKGNKICFASSSKKKLQNICKEAEFLDYKVLWYTGEGQSENVWLESWKDYDLVAYTPKISAGVSYEETHFDKVYGYFSSRSCCAEEAEQMLFRVRNIGMKEIALAFDNRTSNCPTTRKGVIKSLENRTSCSFSLQGIKLDPATRKYHETPRSKAYVETMVRRNISKVNIAGVLLKLLEEQGASVEYAERILKGEELKEVGKMNKLLQEEIKGENIHKICSAPELAREKFSFLCSRKEKTEEEIFSCKKFMLAHGFEVQQSAIIPKFVEVYQGKEKQFKNQKLAFSGTREEQTLRLKVMLKEKNEAKLEMKREESWALSVNLEKVIYARRLFLWLGYESVLDAKKIGSSEMKKKIQEVRQKVAKSRYFQELFGKLPPEQGMMFWVNSILRRTFDFGLKRTNKSKRFSWVLEFSSPWLYGETTTVHQKQKMESFEIPKVC